MAAQGHGQTFDVVNPDGATVGTFTADETTTGDGVFSRPVRDRRRRLPTAHLVAERRDNVV